MKVYATHGAHGSASVEIDSPGEVTLTLNGGGFISGRVVDDHGDPVSEFSITTDKYVMRTGGPPAQSFDSGGGTFNLGPVAPGKVRIWVAANGYQPASLAGLRVKSGETTSGVVVRLKRSGTVSGRVTDATTGRQLMNEATAQALDTLTPREAKVLRLRFGIGVRSDHTLEEVGKVFDLTRERIRQIEAQAIRKLRQAHRSRALRAFFEG